MTRAFGRPFRAAGSGRRTASVAPATAPPPAAAAAASPLHPDEVHLRTCASSPRWRERRGLPEPRRQLIYQWAGDGVPCDQQFILDLATGKSNRVSNGQGKTTCGYFLDGGKRILYASNLPGRSRVPARPTTPMVMCGHVQGLRPLHREGRRPTSSAHRHAGLRRRGHARPTAKTVVFTSVRDGDLEIFTP